ncbi:hypothetical protein GCM10017562_65030 [Streptomyces roseofulvus]|uniref:aminotransferase class IV n=1 Tax=Streptomyces roseofulvus TaxID=33902 RepID=UPI0031FDD954
MSAEHIEIDGRPATVAGMAELAFLNYGHSTAMQVRGGRARGLALHLDRLVEGTLELFGADLDPVLLRRRIRDALPTPDADATVRVYVFGPDPAESPRTMVVVAPASEMPRAPRSLRTVAYQRPEPHLKHIGNFGKIRLARAAERDGYDSVLLTSGGFVSEGATTNIGFFTERDVVWPVGPALYGITMRLLEAHLPQRGIRTRRERVPVDGMATYTGAFVVNSRGVAPVSRLDDRLMPDAHPLMPAVYDAHASVPWDAL